MAQTQKIVILDFGGQYTQLIARRVRECRVYSEVLPYHASVDKIREIEPMGIILSGGPASVLAEDAPKCDPAVYTLGVPVLGICYGMQLTAHLLGGTVEAARQREYGRIAVTMDDKSTLLKDMSDTSSNWMSHTYQVKECPAGFHPIAHTENCPVAAMADDTRHIYGVQFHPEVTHSEEGRIIIRNFLLNICHCAGDWTMDAYAQTAINRIRETVGDKGTVLLALSGGVDSSVAAALIYKAIGDRLTCVYVDHGFMRQGESEQVKEVFSKLFPVRFIPVDASAEFFADLEGVTDPEKKRKIIGRDFIRVFKREAEKLGKLDYFAQGTIYPDVIESGGSKAATIKSHHNVGGLPKNMKFIGVVEPLRSLFKDEVRALGRQLGLTRAYVDRQPFPGPGLGVRIIGEITAEKIRILQEADAIFREEMKRHRIRADQFFAVLTDTRSVGVVGDFRTYDYTVALRAVRTTDFMTCEYAPVPHKVLGVASSRIVNEVDGVGRVVYDITGKPPATIEWC